MKTSKGFFLSITYLFLSLALFASSTLEVANILFLEGKEEKALPLYENWLKDPNNTNTKNFPPVLLRAALLEEDPYLSTALLIQNLSNLQYPSYLFQATYFIAAQLDQCGDFDRAASYYKKTLSFLDVKGFESFIPYRYEIQYRLAAVYAEIGYFSEAASLILPVVEKASDNSIRLSAIMLYSRLLIEQDKIEEGIQAAALVFPFYKGSFPDIVYYWLTFLIESFPKQSETLVEEIKDYNIVLKEPRYEAMPTQSMILSGLYADINLSE